MRRAAVLTAVAALLLAAAGLALTGRSATITLHVAPQTVQASITVTGSRGSDYFPTREVDLQISDSITVPASLGTVGTYATGQVRFRWFDPCVPPPKPCAMYQAPAGSLVQTDSGVVFRTQSEVWWSGPGYSAAVGIRAVSPGPAGNVAAHAITRTTVSPGYALVDNPQATSGGTSRQTHIVAQSDYDTAAATLHDRLESEIQTAMVLNASPLVFVEEGTPRYSLTGNHAVGQEATSLTVTMTATLRANGFSDRLARQLIASQVQSLVPRGMRVIPGSIRQRYEIETLTAYGDVRLRGTATASLMPSASPPGLASRIAGVTVDDARAEVARSFPNAIVSVDVSPIAFGRLPAAPDRISFVFEPV